MFLLTPGAPLCRDASVFAPTTPLGTLNSTTIKDRSRNRLRHFLFQYLPFLFVLFVEDQAGGHFKQVVTVLKEDSFRDGDKLALEGRVTFVAATPTCQLPLLVGNGRQWLAANLIFREVGYL